MPRRHHLVVAVALCAGLAAVALAQEPSLETVLARAASYVSDLHRQLSGIVAEETYVQQVQNSSSRGQSAAAPKQRALVSDFLLVRPPGSDRFVEFRDVFEVDGRAVRDRRDRLTKLFLDRSDRRDQVGAIIDESARYNIGNIPRNVNTPMLPLIFLQPSYQHRFRFKRARPTNPGLAALAIEGYGGQASFRIATDVWVIEFRETERRTIIKTDDGRDFPAAGRFWIDPESGAVLMSELVMDRPEVRAIINVNYRDEPDLGFRVPVEMREQYSAKYDRVEGVATYGRFRQFQVRTDTTIEPPPLEPGPIKAPPKPPPVTQPQDIHSSGIGDCPCHRGTVPVTEGQSLYGAAE